MGDFTSMVYGDPLSSCRASPRLRGSSPSGNRWSPGKTAELVGGVGFPV